MGGADYNTSGAQTFTADDYNLNGTDITFTTSADNVSFVDGGADGSIDLADAADLTISTSNGDIAIGVPILGTAGDGDDATDVTLNAGSGTLSIEDIGTDINDVLLTSSTSITLNGDITTAVDSDETGATSGVVTITGPALLLTEAILIDTDSTSNNGAVSFTSTINSDTNQTLTITSGSGAVDIGGVIGGTAGDHLGGLAINAQGASTGTGQIDIAGIGGAAEYGVEGVTTIGNTASAGVDFDGTTYTVDGALTVTATSTGEAITFKVVV